MVAMLVASVGLASALGVAAMFHSGRETPPGPTQQRAVPPAPTELPPKTALHPVTRVPATQRPTSPEDQQILDQQHDALMRSMGDR
jgi:hypothetical protein